MKYEVSVIVPVYHDWNRLKICINALSKQDYPNDRYEVIIVNNDPSDTPPELKLPDNFRLITEQKPGSYSARNTGIQYSNNEIIVFTDADCIPSLNWLSELLVHYTAEQKNDSNSLLISGDVKLFPQSDEPNWAESYDIIYGTNPKRAFKKGTAPTANLLVHSNVFDDIGLFDYLRFSGGDSEFCKRANSHGYNLSFCSTAIVKHPARENLNEIFVKARRKLASKIYEGIRFKNITQILSPPLYRYGIFISSKEYKFSIRMKALIIVHLVKIVEISELFRLSILKKNNVRD